MTSADRLAARGGPEAEGWRRSEGPPTGGAGRPIVETEALTACGRKAPPDGGNGAGTGPRSRRPSERARQDRDEAQTFRITVTTLPYRVTSSGEKTMGS